MKLIFDFEGILTGKDEKGLKELIAEADHDNRLASLVIARNDQIKAMAEIRLIGMQLQAAEVE